MHPDDDVARNIRAEQQRDAAPSPEEVRQQERDHLRSEGCRECGESDPDVLDRYGINYPSCSAVQHPPDPFVILCDEHSDALTSARERAIERARAHDEHVDAVAFFECENSAHVGEPEVPTMEVEKQVGWNDDDPVYETVEVPRQRAVPEYTVPAECRCGAKLEEVIWLGEEDNDD